MGVALAVATAACTSPPPLGPDGDELAARGRAGQADEIRFIGTLDLVWPGGKGLNAPDEARFAQAEIAAFPSVPDAPPSSGNFTYRVLAMDGSLHREIGVKLTYVHIDVDADTVRFLGEVISDTKPCGGSGHGDDSGCSHDDGDDGGCSHDDGDDSHDDGGCSHDDGDDGGCSHDDGDDSHDDGGCSHDDGSDGGGDDHGEPGGPGGPGGGHVTGADCRIGQVVIGWAQDGGTPAVGNDRISWKWFAPDAQKVLDIEAAIAAGNEVTWPCKLCEKEIIGGNLKVHGK
jgi:hypothetical protein